MLLVYLTCQNKKEAEKIIQALFKKRLIACANSWPSESFYFWKGKLVQEKEIIILVKTAQRHYQKIVKLVEKLHSYEIPIIAGIEVDQINQSYCRWLETEIR